MAGTLVIDAVKSSTSGPPAFQNTSGTEVGQLCRAWVNFNGNGVATVRGSFNVSSLVRNSSGNYQINFTAAFADTNYCAVGFARSVANSGNTYYVSLGEDAVTARTTSGITVSYGTAPITEPSYVNVAIFR